MPSYSSGDPFAGGATSGLSGLLRQGGQYGFFSPEGSAQFRGANRRRILGMGRNRRNRASLLARLAGLDRMGQQQGLLDADRDQADFQSNALNQFDIDEYGGNRDYFRSLMGQQLGIEEQRRQEKMARDAQFRDFLGGLGGMAGNAGLAYLTGGASPADPKRSSRVSQFSIT